MRDVMEYLSIARAAKLIAARQLSVVELTRALLARIEALDGKLNSFICVTADGALKGAARADTEIAAGNYRGPLHGIPIAIKDVFETKGVPTTGHSRLMLDNVPAKDASTVGALANAGAVMLGKLATHEFALGGPSFDLPFPPARNPWDLDRFTGGSSSGSGAAVAAGLCLGSIGTDNGGSIRTPAAMCGIVGLKPTYGRISLAGAMPMSYSLDHCGPMAWTVEDVALMLQVLAGHDPADPVSAKMPVPQYAAALSGNLKGVRVGLVRHFYEEEETATAPVCAAMEAAVLRLSELGAVVNEVRLPSLHEFHACCMIIVFGEAFAIHERDLQQRPQLFGEVARDRLTLAAFLSCADYVHAIRMRSRLTAETLAVLNGCDVLVMPTTLDVAPPITAVTKFGLFAKPSLTPPFNVTGLPAISICCGFEGGLPLGMQIAGRPFEEDMVLRVADAYERTTEWRASRPTLPIFSR
jgi:aspartyl-tRNA(Asn)/glutamyl-tRNA(Gln) amidotransferase subunit A